MLSRVIDEQSGRVLKIPNWPWSLYVSCPIFMDHGDDFLLLLCFQGLFQDQRRRNAVSAWSPTTTDHRVRDWSKRCCSCKYYCCLVGTPVDDAFFFPRCLYNWVPSKWGVRKHDQQSASSFQKGFICIRTGINMIKLNRYVTHKTLLGTLLMHSKLQMDVPFYLKI